MATLSIHRPSAGRYRARRSSRRGPATTATSWPELPGRLAAERPARRSGTRAALAELGQGARDGRPAGGDEFEDGIGQAQRQRDPSFPPSPAAGQMPKEHMQSNVHRPDREIAMFTARADTGHGRPIRPHAQLRVSRQIAGERPRRDRHPHRFGPASRSSSEARRLLLASTAAGCLPRRASSAPIAGDADPTDQKAIEDQQAHILPTRQAPGPSASARAPGSPRGPGSPSTALPRSAGTIASASPASRSRRRQGLGVEVVMGVIIEFSDILPAAEPLRWAACGGLAPPVHPSYPMLGPSIAPTVRPDGAVPRPRPQARPTRVARARRRSLGREPLTSDSFPARRSSSAGRAPVL